MRIIVILAVLITLLQAFRTSIYYLRKDISLIKKIIETIILISMIILNYFNFKESIMNSRFYITIILSIYIIVSTLYEKIFKKEYVSILSVKNAIDMSENGIMFLNDDGSLVLINNVMSDILNKLNIKNDYINNLMKKCIKSNSDDYILKCDNKVYLFNLLNDNELSLIDITELYKLQEQEGIQNEKIKENNERLLDTINNIEVIEKNKNLLKLKNEYHDIIGHRLALFTKYLEQGTTDAKNILFLLDSIYEDFNVNLSSDEKLKNLIQMYQITGINIIVKGNIPLDEKIGNTFFEIIREAVTNAIIHADSKSIKIIITQYLDRVEMTITNDGKMPKNAIFENEGIKGMRRKLAQINGSLNILIENYFTLKIVV